MPPLKHNATSHGELSFRPMIRADMRWVLQISERSFDQGWNEKQFLRCMNQQHTDCMLATFLTRRGELIAGFVAWEKKHDKIELLNIAVHPEMRKAGVGRAILSEMKKYILHDSSRLIECVVRDHELSSQLFLQHSGFLFVEFERNYFEDGELGLRFRYQNKER